MSSLRQVKVLGDAPVVNRIWQHGDEVIALQGDDLVIIAVLKPDIPVAKRPHRRVHPLPPEQSEVGESNGVVEQSGPIEDAATA